MTAESKTTNWDRQCSPVIIITFLASSTVLSWPVTEAKVVLQRWSVAVLQRRRFDRTSRGSLETAAPKKALDGAHINNTDAVMNSSGKGLTHVRDMYTGKNRLYPLLCIQSLTNKAKVPFQVYTRVTVPGGVSLLLRMPWNPGSIGMCGLWSK